MSKFEFVGYPSGDYESFCWDVDKETYIKIKTERYKLNGWSDQEIEEQFNENSLVCDKAVFHEEMFMIYPNDIIDNDFKDKQKITVICEKLQ